MQYCFGDTFKVLGFFKLKEKQLIFLKAVSEE